MDDYQCLTCEYWGGNAGASRGNFESCRQAAGKCYCSSGNNPHYYDADILDADDGCDYWRKHPALR